MMCLLLIPLLIPLAERRTPGPKEVPKFYCYRTERLCFFQSDLFFQRKSFNTVKRDRDYKKNE